ncbi:GHKL domain-containing protein [Clostridium sp. Sa3CUN1]|uniref:GHKL domain-containing protein n=1 Tax=Clostridium gallinarum TaxID=2762246 RepID=A0ABR8Q0B9_9CLOT|nr:GHKL domain-containing protein [Clostridium gallinarum]MBD7913865.1 GHKL domain-containing protein [Clostridium gallinarum]
MEVIGIFIEMMIVTLLYDKLFNNNGNKKKYLEYSIIVIICSILFYKFNTINSIIVYIVLLIAEIVAIAYVDKKDNILALTEVIISVIIGFILQTSIVTICYLFTGKTKEYKVLQLILYVISVLGIMIFLDKKKKNINFEKYVEDNILLSIIALNVFTLFMIFKIVYDNRILYNNIALQINAFILINVFFNINFYRNIHKTILKNKNIEVKSTYNPLIDEIIQNIKASEHEYKNHINMIYSMIQVSKSIPEIKEKASNYVGHIQNKNTYSKVLDIENTIIKAIVYSKLVECEQLGINLNYEIKTNMKNSYIDDTEITILLSNLLNNAIEATKKATNKKIMLDIRYIERYKIQVKNGISGLDIDSEEIENFFKKGFSSKGKGRGYGLFNVKKIVKKYKGNIYARVEEDFLVIDIYI